MARKRPTDSRRAMTLVVFQVATMLLSVVIGILTARLLGVYDRGVYVLAFIPSQLLSSLGASGLSDAAIYVTSREPELRLDVLRTLVGLAGVVSIAVFGLLAAAWVLVGGSVLQGVSLAAFAIASGATPFYLWSSMAQGYLFSLGRTSASQAAVIGERVFTLAGVVAVWIAGGGLIGVIGVTVGGSLCSAVAALYLIGRRDLMAAFRRPRQGELSREMLAYAWHILLTNVAQKLTYRLDQLIVNLLSGPATVGLYSIAARLAEAPLLGPRALRQSWFATRAMAGDVRNSIRATLAGSRKLSLLMAAALPPFGAAGALLIPVAYGQEFAGAVTPFVLLLLGTFALSVSFAFVSGLTGAGKPKRVAVASWIGLAMTVVLDLILVPPLGAEGAALASAGSYATFAVAVYFQWLKEARPYRPRRADLLPGLPDARALVLPVATAVRQRLPNRGST
jgi:O-antigen/teichoic acid export membrane protein